MSEESAAIDPVCGMQVAKANAPAVLTVEGERVYFCSDHCAERYRAALAELPGEGADS